MVIPPATGARFSLATPGLRIISFGIDIIVFFSLLLFFFVAGAFELLLTSDFGKVPPSDPALDLFLVIVTASVPIWDLLLLAGWTNAGQSPGKYVTNTRLTGNQGQRIGPVRALLRLLLHPLAFPTYLLVLMVTLLYSLGRPFFFGAGLLALASLLSGLVSLVFLFTDDRHRALHDILAQTQVERLS